MPAPIITLDVIQSLVPSAQALTKADVKRGNYPNPVTNPDFIAIERGDWHYVYWLDGNNDAHRISRAKDQHIAAFLIWHMTQLITLHIRMQRGRPEPVAEAAPVADESEISLPIPSGSSQFKKQIAYDRKTGDFALTFNGQSVGYASTYLEGEARLNQLAYEALRRAA